MFDNKKLIKIETNISNLGMRTYFNQKYEDQ